ncbi:ATP-dependent 6-phosphofructokinase [Trifolium repens]|nr:ATP-dependent 6-phosphofructokinase [Trifolium repens]
MREHFGAFHLVGDLVQKNVADSLVILSSVNRDPRICQEKQQCEHERLHNSIQDLGINKVYIIGGDGTEKAASVIFEKITIKHYYLWKFYLSLQVLDAPSLQDDFYLNLVDWSSQIT